MFTGNLTTEIEIKSEEISESQPLPAAQQDSNEVLVIPDYDDQPAVKPTPKQRPEDNVKERKRLNRAKRMKKTSKTTFNVNLDKNMIKEVEIIEIDDNPDEISQNQVEIVQNQVEIVTNAKNQVKNPTNFQNQYENFTISQNQHKKPRNSHLRLKTSTSTQNQGKNLNRPQNKLQKALKNAKKPKIYYVPKICRKVEIVPKNKGSFYLKQLKNGKFEACLKTFEELCESETVEEEMESESFERQLGDEIYEEQIRKKIIEEQMESEIYEEQVESEIYEEHVEYETDEQIESEILEEHMENETIEEQVDDEMEFEEYLLEPLEDGTSKMIKIKEEISSELLENETLYKCSHCNLTFEFRTSLIVHELQHLPKVKCAICQQNVFAEKLKIHQKKCQFEAKQEITIEEEIVQEQVTQKTAFKCYLCDWELTSQKYLDFHVRNMHKSNKIACTICKKIYFLEETLTIHMKEVHNGR